ncbi:SDR family NAD(P)-dependent oxidoreductase [Vulgatibacter incomptus]|uniref:SDR family NAD(P)-dependent oxidoreductase n=1 Tax=Vulgatibacter incomptus TaxID=1391653 RepID=UPI001F0AA09C|nr:SDR family NAD(P)-dependent oxidoreductase [Vulgatibacter incomptus]
MTGASSGLGASLAKRLAAGGAEVALCARRAELLEELAAEIRSAGGKARIYPADLSDPVATQALVRRVDDELGGLDLVIANAGIGVTRWAGKLDWEAIAPTVDLDVSGAVATLTAVLPRMVERKRGHIVGISSLAGYRGMPRSAAYSASKAFLAVFLESLRVDLRGTGVTVTDVRPGFVRTPLIDANPYPMPFLLEVEDATERMIRGIEQGKAVVAFPWPLATIVRLSRLVPASLYDRVMGGLRTR